MKSILDITKRLNQRLEWFKTAKNIAIAFGHNTKSIDKSINLTKVQKESLSIIRLYAKLYKGVLL